MLSCINTDVIFAVWSYLSSQNKKLKHKFGTDRERICSKNEKPIFNFYAFISYSTIQYFKLSLTSPKKKKHLKTFGEMASNVMFTFPNDPYNYNDLIHKGPDS